MVGTPNQIEIENANQNIDIEKNCLDLFHFDNEETIFIESQHIL